MADWNELHKTMAVKIPDETFIGFVKEFLKPGMRVLDLGCGSGRHSLYCAQKGIETHAVDISDNGLNMLRKESEKDSLFELLKITKSNMSELPFPNEYFDVIVCVNAINHGYRKDVESYFREATRVLGSGGYFFLIRVPMEFLEEVKTDKTKELEKGTFIEINMPDHDIPHHFLTDEELKLLLKDYKLIKDEKFRKRSHWKDVMVTREEIIAQKI